MSEKKLSKVKQLILKILRSKKYTHFSELLDLTNQKHFDRRIRELKSEQGYDIEVVYKNGAPHYTLKSEFRNPPKKRTYLKKLKKDQILKESGEKCPLCNKRFSKKFPKILDHRVPVIREGGGSKENFQVICHPCNNQKRSQCRGCKLDCYKCFLAFPEKYPQPLFIKLSHNLDSKLEKFSKKNNKKKLQMVKEILKRTMKGKN